MSAPAWQPTVADVGALLRARTVDSSGNELGTFTSTTRPTGDAVDQLIGLAVGQIQGEIGPDIPDVLHDQARRCAILGAAVLIERSYWPEQQDEAGRTAQSTYAALYERAVSALASAQRSYTATASSGGGMGLGTMRVRSLNELGDGETA